MELEEAEALEKLEKQSVEEEKIYDEDWRQKQIQNLARNLLEEAKLKRLVISKERELAMKRKRLEILRSDYYEFFTRLFEESSAVTLHVNDYESFCIEMLEKRIEYLHQRAGKLQADLDEYGQKLKNENNDNAFADDLNSTILKQLNETLYENKTLEKYIRSENFRIYDETIGCLKFNLDTLNNRKREIKDVRASMVSSEEKKRHFLGKLQRKYQKLCDADS